MSDETPGYKLLLKLVQRSTVQRRVAVVCQPFISNAEMRQGYRMCDYHVMVAMYRCQEGGYKKSLQQRSIYHHAVATVTAKAKITSCR